ncbi:uncharacterized protein LOC110837537 isoform X2 [Zootermopsis nevadensis]|uniref:uncharacterized protein LOC110837537 isoform X2 n=1 Tax=Zootermopsis nevadensis TaxID=136037 RepID=UPI000B8E29ED|nr:uncharacterized protein LOC110837537 isoform X2 [Zootermopsis nevadensis]
MKWILVTPAPDFHSTMKPCPSFKSKRNFGINKIMGEWNLAMLLIDEPYKQPEDDSSCIKGNFKKINSTAFKQIWYEESPQYGYGAIIDLPTVLAHTGDWTVTDPLGGHIQLKIARASPSHLCMTFCGTHHGKSTHLWTAVVTRKKPINNMDFLILSAELLAQGFSNNDSNIIKWDKC